MARSYDFKPSTILERFALCGGYCEGELPDETRCNRKLFGGDYAADHDIPGRMGGKPTLQNCRILCLDCHDRKTRTVDAPRIAKTRRMEWKNKGPKPASKFRRHSVRQRTATRPVAKLREFMEPME
jgi:5-methylcytosine-specific restriction protein A